MTDPLTLLDFLPRRQTPIIYQSEASECGLACLAMVAAAHGLDIDLLAIRRRFSVSLKGTTLRQLIEVAQKMSFNARPLRGEIGSLDALELPAILHWDLNHFRRPDESTAALWPDKIHHPRSCCRGGRNRR